MAAMASTVAICSRSRVFSFRFFPRRMMLPPLMWHPAQCCSNNRPPGLASDPAASEAPAEPRLSSRTRNAPMQQRRRWLSTGMMWLGSVCLSRRCLLLEPLDQFIGRAVILRKRGVQSVEVVPADRPANGVEVASIGHKATQGLAVGRESSLQISDGECLGCGRHETEGQDLLTFASIP